MTAGSLGELPARLTVLHIRPTLPVGGSTEYIIRLSDGLRRRGHRTIIVSGGGPWAVRARRVAEYHGGYRLAPFLGTSRSIPNVLDILPTSLRLARLVRRERVQVINSHHRYAAVVGKLAAAMTGAALVSTVHEVRRDLRLPAAVGAGERFIVLSRAVQQHVITTYGIESDRVRVVPMGIDIPEGLPRARNRALLRELEIDAEAPVIGCVARLSKRKGQSFLLDALASLTRDHPNVRLLLIGDGEDRPQLQERTQQLGLSDHVKFLGARTDVPALIALCQFTVLPSLQEEFGIVLLESFAQGRPVIASDVGGIPEIVTSGMNGFLVPSGDSRRLAAAIHYLLSHPDARSHMGERARRLVLERYSTSRFIEDTEAVYAEVVRNIDRRRYAGDRQDHS